jgi:peptide/nickel transport system permease protein
LSEGSVLAARARPRTRLLRSQRLRVIGRQLGVGLVTLFLISVVAFGMMSVRTPEQIAREKFGNQITTAQVDAFAHQYGLDEPIYTRYGTWLWHFAQGDMGTSFVTDTPVESNVIPRFVRTLILSVISLLIAIPISVWLGVFQARRLGSWSDMSLLTGSVIIAALPEFVVGIGLLFVFAVELGWLPVDSATALTFASSFTDRVKAYVLPCATLVLAMVPYIARIARGSMREALGMPYTQAAVLRGLPRRTVIWDHAMRNAGVPLVNAVSVNVVYLLSGVIVVEWVFAFPGIGQGIVQATSTSDAFNVEAMALMTGAMFICVSLAADLVVAYLNPRLKAAAVK